MVHRRATFGLEWIRLRGMTAHSPAITPRVDGAPVVVRNYEWDTGHLLFRMNSGEKLRIREQIARDMKQLQEALESIDGDLTTVTFNPHDPASIDAAIQQIEATLDERLGPYTTNPFVGPLLESMKENHRAGLIERATSARLETSK